MDISEKAVVGMTPLIEFQKLELQGRKAYVLKSCMEDRGFHDSSAWRTHAEPLAKINVPNKTYLLMNR